MNKANIRLALQQVEKCLEDTETFVIVADGENGAFRMFHDCTGAHAVGLLEMGKSEILRAMHDMPNEVTNSRNGN